MDWKNWLALLLILVSSDHNSMDSVYFPILKDIAHEYSRCPTQFNIAASFGRIANSRSGCWLDQFGRLLEFWKSVATGQNEWCGCFHVQLDWDVLSASAIASHCECENHGGSSGFGHQPSEWH